MNSCDFTAKDILEGPIAFYNQANYKEITKNELGLKKLDRPIYVYNTESKVWRIAKYIFSIIIFPIGLYKFIHSFSGRFIVPASMYNELQINLERTHLIDKIGNSEGEWKVKRISIKVDGYLIDAAIIGKTSTLRNGRWVLYSNGNGELYERTLTNFYDAPGKHLSWDRHPLEQILPELNGNALVFNYPGVGASTGAPNRNAMTKAYCAMLNFLEDSQKGVGANQIIGYGHSLGGGVQADALLLHERKPNIDYVFIKSRTFSDLSTTVSNILNRFFGFLIKIFGWNMSPLESSKKLEAPEIIMQRASVEQYTNIKDLPKQVMSDGVIPAEASLAKNLIEARQRSFNNKHFLGTPDNHNDGLSNPRYLIEKIKEFLPGRYQVSA